MTGSRRYASEARDRSGRSGSLEPADRDPGRGAVDPDEGGVGREVDRPEAAVLDRTGDADVAGQRAPGQADRYAADRGARAEAVGDGHQVAAAAAEPDQGAIHAEQGSPAQAQERAVEHAEGTAVGQAE